MVKIFLAKMSTSFLIYLNLYIYIPDKFKCLIYMAAVYHSDNILSYLHSAMLAHLGYIDYSLHGWLAPSVAFNSARSHQDEKFCPICNTGQ